MERRANVDGIRAAPPAETEPEFGTSEIGFCQVSDYGLGVQQYDALPPYPDNRYVCQPRRTGMGAHDCLYD
jgi:hypothetical protein